MVPALALLDQRIDTRLWQHMTAIQVVEAVLKAGFADYGREDFAREKYARLATARNASACLDCPAPCAGACPFELPIRAKMVRAHERLRA